ncbi:helix-turn-helix domain-containing protein [Acinetobacter junii]|uniref:helix-turn-helix domain-containing protein n=1 Tax=Acinetobacter junii TaxID=40215 RepID=UPI001D17D736|nr:helix-turn-helix transcriptional regulator [Acinetobacter junii]
MNITQSNVNPKVVLAKALLNTADQLGLKQAQVASVIGVHRSSISRLKAKPILDSATKQGELALLLIGIYRAVYALNGGDPEWIHHFMNSYNDTTREVPIKQGEFKHEVRQFQKPYDNQQAEQISLMV